MKKNQLKFRIWNSLKGKCLSDEVIAALTKEFNEIELGAFIDLYADSRIGSVFLDTIAKDKGCIGYFIEAEAKNAVRKYLELLNNSYMTKIRQRVFLNELEDMIHSLAEDVKAAESCGLVYETRLALLDYVRVLRTRLDSPAIDTSETEARLFRHLNLNYDGVLLFDAFSVLEMYIEEVHDVGRLTEIYETHDLALEQYIRDLDDTFDCLFKESFS